MKNTHADFWIYASGTPLPSRFPYSGQLWISKSITNQFLIKLPENTIRDGKAGRAVRAGPWIASKKRGGGLTFSTCISPPREPAVGRAGPQARKKKMTLAAVK